MSLRHIQLKVNWLIQIIIFFKDDKILAPYNLAPIVRDDVLKSNPKIESTLNKISEKIGYSDCD